MKLSRGAFYFAVAVTGAGIAGGIVSCHYAFYSAAKGEAFLESKGYTVLGGGGRDFINTCGKNVFARSYEVVTPEGKTKNQTVCFSPLIGPHRPLIGG